MYSFLVRVRGGAVMVNENVVEPPLAESVTVVTPAAVLDRMLNVADAELPVPLSATLLNVRPDQAVESETPQRLLPLIVTAVLAPRAPLLGVAEVTAGPAGGLIVMGAETVTPGVLLVFLTALK